MWLIEEKKQIYKHQKENTLSKDFVLEVANRNPLAVVSCLIDNEEYQSFCLDLIKKDYNLLNNREVLNKIFSNNSTIKFVLDNLELILNNLVYKVLFLNYFLNYAKHTNKELYKLVAYSIDLDIRSEVMEFLATNDRESLKILYPNITDYFIVKDANGNVVSKMKEIDLSIIAANLFDFIFDAQLFTEIKEYIFANYPKNHLLGFLARNDEMEDDIFHFHEEIVKDFERLYKTSFDYQLEAMDKYKDLIPQEDYLKLAQIIEMFKFQIERLEEIFKKGLGDDFIHMLKKYSSISEDSTIEYNNGNGSVTDMFNVGDFSIKFISGVHHFFSIEERYHPCFLVNKVVEEKIYYDEDGNLLGILQVGQRLFRSVKDKNLQKLFEDELAKLGYFVYDVLIEKDNLYYLNDYHDADTFDPETLPEWFKENPVVLVDLDLMFKLEQREEVEKLALENKRGKNKRD